MATVGLAHDVDAAVEEMGVLAVEALEEAVEVGGDLFLRLGVGGRGCWCVWGGEG